jgi:DNA-binding transcriptional LysR family regulator
MKPLPSTWQIDPTSLRLFIAVCEEGSIARAAEREFIASSAISKRIADLESLIATPLLSRSQRGVTPTAAGAALLGHARLLMRGMEKLHAELGEYAAGARGTVRILANVSSMVEFLPEELAAFLREHPQIRIDLEERVSSEIARGVAEGAAELGICRSPADAAGLQVLPYRCDHLAVVVQAQHPLAALKTVWFEQTLSHDQLGLSSNASINTLMQRIALEHGRELRYRIHVSTFDGAFRLIQAGLALAVLPLEAVGRYSELYGLRVIALADAWARRDLVICVRDAASLSPPASRLLEHLRSRAPLSAA